MCQSHLFLQLPEQPNLLCWQRWEQWDYPSQKGMQDAALEKTGRTVLMAEAASTQANARYSPSTKAL